MSRSTVATVTRWEYRRFTKIKDLVIGTLIFAVLFGIFGFVAEFVERKTNEPLRIAVVGGGLMGLEQLESLQRYRLEPADSDIADLEDALADDAIDAVRRPHPVIDVVAHLGHRSRTAREHDGCKRECLRGRPANEKGSFFIKGCKESQFSDDVGATSSSLWGRPWS